ncbi:FAD-dependent monooxygenase [Tengunoibacter tsumagoiensis]|uniref:FAD-dependent oxidoreductase n=1 Tax=Tengunoibacter tsumagoiensis TaxID=2014871 RepID=A0A401ZUW0_9CHLR|nr:FAD-dependent monooxygenase [Tengunoibacter tsumagoiensis]GCE10699.1 FAD-dependent oxidoreductase [Tengunoibacter tsumagoiensis]
MTNNSLKNRTILISGASIAGPALAYWLSRYGFKPTIVERAPAPRAGGNAIDIRGGSRAVVERMGIMPAIRQALTNQRGMSFVDSSNRPQATMGVELFGGEGLVSDFEILRGDLVQILYEATRDTTEYIFHDTITALSENEEGIQVTFEKGQPRIFDLVLGADGLHSTVRQLSFGAESEFSRHLGYYISIFTAANHLQLDRWQLVYNMPGKLAGVYTAHQNSEVKAMFLFASSPLQYDRHNSEEQKKILTRVFANEGWEIPRLLNAMDDAPDFYFDSISLIQMERWSKGRIALVGDAGYCPSPLSGQGTNLALVGAYVLAGELAAAAGEYQTAFARYEEKMRGYVEKNQKAAVDGGKWFIPPTQSMIRLRNLNMRMLPYLPWKGLIARAIQKQTAITLQDYTEAQASSGSASL